MGKINTYFKKLQKAYYDLYQAMLLSKNNNKKVLKRAGELVEQLRELSTLEEVPNLIPSNHMGAHNHL